MYKRSGLVNNKHGRWCCARNNAARGPAEAARDETAGARAPGMPTLINRFLRLAFLALAMAGTASAESFPTKP
jgi:hypothetical protein